MWEWILVQLGWQGIELGWVQILVLVFTLVGALIVLRNLIGGRSGGGGGSTIAYPPSERQSGLPIKYYIGSERLGDFSISPGVYDSKVPSPTPNLSELRKPIRMDLEKAKELFLPAGRRSPDSLKVHSEGEIPGQDLSAGSGEGVERSVAADGSGTSQPASPSFRPDWELASKLFVPRMRR